MLVETDSAAFHAGAGAVSNRVMSGEAFEAVVSAHHGEIFRYLQRVVGRTADADDLSQETFLRAFRAYGSLPGDANLRAWLFSIATNLARNHFRSESRRRRAYGEVRVSVREAAVSVPEAEVVSRETGALVEGIVRRLPSLQPAIPLQPPGSPAV